MSQRSAVAMSDVRDADGSTGLDALDGVAERLRGAGVLDLEIGADRTRGGQRWAALPALTARAPDWHAELTRSHGDARAAAMFLAGWVAGTPALVVGLPALLGAVTIDVEAEAIALRRAAAGWVEAYAIDRATVEVGAAVDDGVLASAAERIARLTAPLVDQLCGPLPVGPVAVWGGVADTLTAYALWFARQGRQDERRAWADADRLLDHLSERAPIRPRPRVFPVTWSGGVSHQLVRGTCCLYYRTCVDLEPDARYCATCPLRSDASRTDRLVAHLESTA